MVCLCLTAATVDGWVAHVADHGRWAHAFELRFDLLSSAGGGVLEEVRDRVLPMLGDKPWIATVRRSDDLGRWPDADEDDRRRYLTRIVEHLGPDYVDLEADGSVGEVAAAAREAGSAIVWSIHDGEAVPADVERLLDSIARRCEGRDVAKLAVMPRSARDVTRLVRAARSFGTNEPRRVILGMGEYGLVTRVAPWILGSEWSYASRPGAARAAPGHVGPRELRELYRVGDAREGWRLFAVLGAPVAHSLSPAYHNARFAADGVEAVYVPIRADSFSEFEELAEELGIAGVSVTVPHKEAALAAASNQSAAAARVGAANTLVRGGGGWSATNTDVEGFLSALPEPKVRRALVVGAGGAARAVVAALVDRAVEVTICNRTVERAIALARELGIGEGAVLPLQGPFDDLRFDIVVQTTSVGMEPNVDADPIPAYQFSGREVVYDVIYTPERTRFLARAADAGCSVITGRAMFDAQAAAQYELFRSAGGTL